MNLQNLEIILGLAAAAAAGAVGFAIGRRTRAVAGRNTNTFCDCHLTLDPDGDILSVDAADDEIEQWRHLGLSPWTDAFHPDDLNAIEQALAAPGLESQLAKVRLRSGNRHWREGSLTVRGAIEGAPAHAYFRGSRTTRASPESGSLLSPVIAAITHQLNNRLHLIRGFAELSLQRESNSPSEESGLSRINEVVDESAELLRQLGVLSTSRAADPKSFDLCEELPRLIHSANAIVGERVRIVLEVPESPLVTRVPLLPLQQALTGLLILSAENQGRRGDIIVRVERTHATAISIEVRTHGDSSPQSPDDEDTLALVLDRLEACGAQLEVDSLGRGRPHFRVLLPTESAAAIPIHAAGNLGHGQNILVVDTSAEDREIICVALEEAGYRTWEATSGSEAVAMAEGLEPLELLIIDLLLDSETGVEVSERVAAHCGGVRVLYTTSFPAVLGVSTDVGEHGAALPKPFKREVLIERVRQALSS